jgi:hypothetical protein
MRVFQNGGTLRSYRKRLKKLTANAATFKAARQVFLDDRFGAAHFLKPILDGDESAFFANGDEEYSQRLWAHENGLARTSTLDQILLAQIEDHRTEVFYNLDPMRFGDDFINRMPGHVRKTIAWRAAPSAGGRFFQHDLLVNNFPSILETYRQAGAKVAYFSPAHDPAMDEYAVNKDRPIDVLFVGTYSRHHFVRAQLLDCVSALRSEMSVALHLDKSRFTALAESPLGLLGPLKQFRRSKNIIATSEGPVFGRDLLRVLSAAKIVVNGAIDMAGSERGNLRIWEALGCGAALISDEGKYPNGMSPQKDFAVYANVDSAIGQIRTLSRDDGLRSQISGSGNDMIRALFSKQNQWKTFQELAA